MKLRKTKLRRMKLCKFRFALLLAATSLALIGVAVAQDFKKQVIYQIVTDRFFNGDTTNDNPAQSAGLFDSTKTNWFAYWGGDLAGIQAKMAYIKGMGVIAAKRARRRMRESPAAKDARQVNRAWQASQSAASGARTGARRRSRLACSRP